MALGLLPYVAARIGLSPAPFIAADRLPPVADMRPDPSPRLVRLAGSGTSVLSGMIVDNDPCSDVKDSLWYGSMGGAGIADKMLRDPIVRQSVRYIIDPLVAAVWKIVPGGKRPEDIEAAAFCQRYFIDEFPWSKYLESAITNYAARGFSLHEMTEAVVDLPPDMFPLHPGGGRAIVPKALNDIPCNTVYAWQQKKSNSSQLESFTQYVPYSDTEPSGFRTIPADRVIRLTYGQDGAKFTGFAPLRSAYGPWKLKTAFQTIEAILHDRCGVPYPSITASENPSDEDLDKAEAILSEMRSNPRGKMLLANGYTFEWKQATADDAENLRESIIRCNIDIKDNVSAAFMSLGTSTKSGSFALGGTQSGQYHLAVVGHSKFVGETFARGCDGWSPIERTARLNYGQDVATPRLVATRLPTHDWETLAKSATNAIVGGAITPDDPTEECIREWMQLPPRDKATSRKKADPAQQIPSSEPTHIDDEEVLQDA